MQSRHSAEAPEQAPAADNQAAQPKNMAEQAFEQLTELAAISWSVTANYTEQVKLTGQTANAEWQLSSRSLVIAAALIVFFGAGLILLWGSILLLLGYLLFQATMSLAITAVALFVLQFGALLWCWRSLAYVLKQVGFKQTWRHIRRMLRVKDKDPGHAD
ncbi:MULTISPECIES: hypothetical protein [Rheinheimera]|uniref:hypothetical protein n=1 Tax=Rheinheimera TaxID=67575 RepID=UPI0010527317|nr:hypothetical protein [Rheinheimera sp. D18]QBL08733.1 hypothetical protein E0Z06_03980 [Rheinheimera sp. D18]